MSGTSFSILERIEWAATLLIIREAVMRNAFSILERIEWAATSSCSDESNYRLTLSVSSNGSNGLRLCAV